MTIKELIERLKTLPQDAQVVKVNYAGCYECNPESMPNYDDVYQADFMERAKYPFEDLKNVVVI